MTRGRFGRCDTGDSVATVVAVGDSFAAFGVGMTEEGLALE
jgi:hypothetical protein